MKKSSLTKALFVAGAVALAGAAQADAIFYPDGTVVELGNSDVTVMESGAIVASPVLADWDPEPDYFFHWYRDSALVIDALRRLAADGGLDGAEARRHLADFVDFSLSLGALDGRALAADPQWGAGVSPEFRQ